MGFRGWDCRNWIPKYLEISSVLLHVLLHAQAELLDPLPLGVHSGAVGLENTEKGTGTGAFTARRDRNDQNLAAARRVWTQELADPVSVSLWLTHPRCLRQEQFCFYPMEKVLLQHHRVPGSLDDSRAAKTIPCITSLQEKLVLFVFVS